MSNQVDGINIFKPSGYISNTRFNDLKFYVLSAYYVYVFCMYRSANSNICCVPNWLVSVPDMASAYCAVRTVHLNETDSVWSLKGL